MGVLGSHPAHRRCRMSDQKGGQSFRIDQVPAPRPRTAVLIGNCQPLAVTTEGDPRSFQFAVTSSGDLMASRTSGPVAVAPWAPRAVGDGHLSGGDGTAGFLAVGTLKDDGSQQLTGGRQPRGRWRKHPCQGFTPHHFELGNPGSSRNEEVLASYAHGDIGRPS